jgi:hypothetical protein
VHCTTKVKLLDEKHQRISCCLLAWYIRKLDLVRTSCCLKPILRCSLHISVRMVMWLHSAREPWESKHILKSWRNSLKCDLSLFKFHCEVIIVMKSRRRKQRSGQVGQKPHIDNIQDRLHGKTESFSFS